MATATADPPELPPAMWPSSDRQTFFVGPKMESMAPEPMLNSSKFVLPINTAPASFKRVNGVALYDGTKFSSILHRRERNEKTTSESNAHGVQFVLKNVAYLDAHVVGKPFTQKLSLIAIGMPSK